MEKILSIFGFFIDDCLSFFYQLNEN